MDFIFIQRCKMVLIQLKKHKQLTHFFDTQRKILVDEKIYKNISVYNISYKNLTAAKSLRIRFDKID